MIHGTHTVLCLGITPGGTHRLYVIPETVPKAKYVQGNTLPTILTLYFLFCSLSYDQENSTETYNNMPCKRMNKGSIPWCVTCAQHMVLASLLSESPGTASNFHAAPQKGSDSEKLRLTSGKNKCEIPSRSRSHTLLVCLH